MAARKEGPGLAGKRLYLGWQREYLAAGKNVYALGHAGDLMITRSADSGEAWSVLTGRKGLLSLRQHGE
jgi:photosystem II stability/assembly factor-like uncharacterized protein